MRPSITALNALDREIGNLNRARGKYNRELPVFEPHEGQREILESQGRYNVLCCGRRFGKTMLGINLLLEPALLGLPVAWFSPVYKSITEVWRQFSYYLAPAIRSQNAQEKRIELYTGGSIEFWSLDKRPDLVRGRAYKTIFIDEAAVIQNLKQVYYLILRALLTDYEGTAWFASTPRGFNDFYDFWQMGQNPEYPKWQSWQIPSHKNPYISPGELEEARAEMPSKMYAQEYLAEFLPTLSGGMFDRDWFQIIDRIPSNIGAKVRAWDLASSTSETADFSAGVLMAKGEGEDPSYYVLDVIRGRWSPAQRDAIIRQTAERDGPGVPVVIEEEGGSAGKSQSLSLSRLLSGYRLVPVRPTGDKATRAAPFASQVENGNVRVFRGSWNIEYFDELQSFPDPLAFHDDMVDASAYAFNHLIEGNRYKPYIGVSVLRGES
jgi:predicted phage terminase large subunit-like protein